MSASLTQKTQLYHHLCVGYKAGLPLDLLLQAASLPTAYAGQSAALRADLQQGKTLSTALALKKLVSPWEAKLLAIGEQSGRLEAVLEDLEQFFSGRMQRLSELKAKLYYPAIVLVFAFVLPQLPQVVGGTLGLGTYMFTVGSKLFLLWLFYRVLVIGPFEKAANSAFNPLLLKLLAVVEPDHLLREIFEINYLSLLALCLDSGLDAAETLRLLKDSSTSKQLRHQHQKAISDVQNRGLSLTLALTTHGILKNQEICSFLHSSEQAGSLHSALREYLARKKVELDKEINFQLKRLGRWLYILVLLFVAMGIV